MERAWSEKRPYRVVDLVTGQVWEFTAAWLVARFLFIKGMGKFKDLAVFKQGGRFRRHGGDEKEYAKSLQRWKPKER